MKRRLPSYVYNPISLAGVVVSLFAAAAIVLLYVFSLLEGDTSPYLGIFMLVLLPGALVVGMLTIFLGARRARKRHQEPPVLDLREPKQRRLVVTFLVGTCLFLLGTTVGLFKTYEYTESNQFCGIVCHEPMVPEYTAWADSPHAGAHCVDCHVGPGFDWFLKAKLNGARQLFQLARGTFSRPIPTPVHFLRPARDICQQCHWSDQYHEPKIVTYDHYLGDEANTHWQIKMLFEVGGTAASRAGSASGAHWHNDPANRMTLIATDEKRREFDQIVWHHPDGDVVYTRAGTPPLDELAIAEARGEDRVRALDCLDCHNRPAHHFDSPMETVNRALALGDLDAGAPYLKREAIRALSADFETRGEAHAGIASALTAAYDRIDAPVPHGSVDALQRIYDRHMFPHMRVTWDAYPNHDSHLFSAGCFRCHGSDLRTENGRGISGDCKICHKIIAQGAVGSASKRDAFHWTEVHETRTEGLDFLHPVDVDGAEIALKCHECHIGDDTVYGGP